MNDQDNKDKYKSTKQYSVIDKGLKFSSAKNDELDPHEPDDNSFKFGAETKEILNQYQKTSDSNVENTSELMSVFAGTTEEYLVPKDDSIPDEELAEKLSKIHSDVSVENTSESEEFNYSAQEHSKNVSSAVDQTVDHDDDQRPNNNPATDFSFTVTEEANVDDEWNNQQTETAATELEKTEENIDNDVNFQAEDQSSFDSYHEDTNQNKTVDEKMAEEASSHEKSQHDDADAAGLMTRYDLELDKLNHADGNHEEISYLKEKISILQSQVELFRPSHEMIEKVRNTQEYLQIQLKTAADREKYAAVNFIKDIIEPFHWLELTILNMPEMSLDDVENQRKLIGNFSKGLEIVIERFMNVFKDNGMTVISPKIGDAFNERYHEAIDTESDTEYPLHSIIKVVKKGFLLHDRLLKPATVVIAK